MSQEAEKISGIVERVTFHNEENGWSVLKVSLFSGHYGHKSELTTVVVHQSKVFAGATMEFYGSWVQHPRFGEQFKAVRQVEKRPASTAAIEKYLGSGLIFGVGPQTAKKIVGYFKEKTLDVFENRIDQLLEVRGIAKKKLKQIKLAWEEHREIRNVMLFLQDHGISTLFAVRIYKKYGNDAISIVQKNPYQLAKDFYGIGFFSADKIALSLGIEKEGRIRLNAGIKHVLSAAREEGHVYLYFNQIQEQLAELLEIEIDPLQLAELLNILDKENEIFIKEINGVLCYYSRSLYFDELTSSNKIKKLISEPLVIDRDRIASWVTKFTERLNIKLSESQFQAIFKVISSKISILTGGPGCGKTTTTNVIVKLAQAMGKKILLAAPTGRAAQRMSEIIGIEAKTIHRLLKFTPAVGGFKKGEDDPLETDFLVVDECSMLDISLFSSLLKAVPLKSQVLLVGDSDQLPSVGPGNVFRDLQDSGIIEVAHLKEIFRQAQASYIIKHAHEINEGELPQIESPLKHPENWTKKDCHFIDSDQMTKEQLKFVLKAKKIYEKQLKELNSNHDEVKDQDRDREQDKDQENEEFLIPEKYQHVVLEKLINAKDESEELLNLLKRVPRWSTLNYGMTAQEMLVKLLLETIPKFKGTGIEVQILSPMTKGSLGTYNLNSLIQNTLNPEREGIAQVQIGGKILRVGDRVIQKRNNYDLGVFNGDIGIIKEVRPLDHQSVICFDYKTKNPRVVEYTNENLTEIDLAYAITIHKSQGSEFDVVIMPILTQHFKMLFRNLIYTGLTRAKKTAILLGQRKALAMAVNNKNMSKRQTGLVTMLLETNK